MFTKRFVRALAVYNLPLNVQGHHTIKGTVIEKVHTRFAALGGRSQRASAESFSASHGNKLQHSDPGLVSVHQDGSHFALTLGRALALDENYTVVGRVGKGLDVLEKLNDVETDAEGEPDEAIVITQCGTTDHMGKNEVLGTANTKALDVESAKQGIAGASAQVKDALKQGLKRERAEPSQGLRERRS